MLRLRRPLSSGCAVLPLGKDVLDDSEQMLRLRRPLCSGCAVLPFGKGVGLLVGWGRGRWAAFAPHGVLNSDQVLGESLGG
jgi:hypothetical protein